MIAGSTTTTVKTAFPGASLLAAIWTEHFLQEWNFQPFRSLAQYKRSTCTRQTLITWLETLFQLAIKFCCLNAQVFLMSICIVKPSSLLRRQNTSTLKMEILCCSGALFAEWGPVELQHFTSENNGSARKFHYNIKMIIVYYHHHHHHHLYIITITTFIQYLQLHTSKKPCC